MPHLTDGVKTCRQRVVWCRGNKAIKYTLERGWKAVKARVAIQEKRKFNAVIPFFCQVNGILQLGLSIPALKMPHVMF